MATVVKRKLSGSTDGMGILIDTTATVGTAIHTAVAGTTAGTFDEIWLYGFNSHTSAVTLTIEFGDGSAPSHNIVVTLASNSGLQLLVPGLILQNAATVKAFASTTSVTTLSGWVNSITD
jgi:hypothetical protein